MMMLGAMPSLYSRTASRICVRAAPGVGVPSGFAGQAEDDDGVKVGDCGVVIGNCEIVADDDGRVDEGREDGDAENDFEKSFTKTG